MSNTVRKWKRLCKGKYATALDDGRTLIVDKLGSYWHAYIEGGYCVRPRDCGTLAAVKSAVSNGELLPALVSAYENKQLDDATKNAAAAAKLAAEKKRDAALTAPTYDPTAGVSWFEWAERFVGCSAAEVRKADKGRERRWKWWWANAV